MEARSQYNCERKLIYLKMSFGSKNIIIHQNNTIENKLFNHFTVPCVGGMPTKNLTHR